MKKKLKKGNFGMQAFSLLRGLNGKLPSLFLWLALCFVLTLISCNSKDDHSSHEHGEAVYTCPMHPEIVRDHPADCPLCGMDLVLKTESPKESEDHKAHNHDAAEVYTCPMHPEIIQDQPGECPLCGMDLVLKTETSEGREGHTSVAANMELVTPVEKEVPVVIGTSGYITYDLRQMRTISARYSGRIDKAYVKYNFQPVQKGQRLMDIYSPELVTAQQQLLYLIQNDPKATALIEGAKRKLGLLGVSSAQIAQIIQSGKVKNHITVYSPYDGYLSEITKTGEEAVSNAVLSIKEGMYVDKGETLFKVYNPEKVWAVLKIYTEDVNQVALGQSVALTLEDQTATVYQGKIDFIEPFYGKDENFLNVRIYLPNPNQQLKIGELVEAKIRTGEEKGLWLPETAVLDLGLDKVVWLKKATGYEAHKVLTGVETNGLIEIVNGLEANDHVIRDARYLVDSQSFIKISKNENN